MHYQNCKASGKSFKNVTAFLCFPRPKCKPPLCQNHNMVQLKWLKSLVWTSKVNLKNTCVTFCFYFNIKNLICFPGSKGQSTCVRLWQLTWRNILQWIILQVVPSIIHSFMWERSIAVTFRNPHLHSSFVKIFNINKHITMCMAKTDIATGNCSCQSTVNVLKETIKF